MRRVRGKRDATALHVTMPHIDCSQFTVNCLAQLMHVNLVTFDKEYEHGTDMNLHSLIHEPSRRLARTSDDAYNDSALL